VVLKNVMQAGENKKPASPIVGESYRDNRSASHR